MKWRVVVGTKVISIPLGIIRVPFSKIIFLVVKTSHTLIFNEEDVLRANSNEIKGEVTVSRARAKSHISQFVKGSLVQLQTNNLWKIHFSSSCENDMW